MSRSVVEILEGVREIGNNEMMTRGNYVSHDVVRPDLADKGAICGGRQACAVGSLFLAAGVPFDIAARVSTGFERHRFMADHPDLRAAYDALNAAAYRYIGDHELSERFGEENSRLGWAEVLFESDVFSEELRARGKSWTVSWTVKESDEHYNEIQQLARACMLEIVDMALADLAAA